MTRKEATAIVDKIQVYRQSFLITNRVYEEWFRVLEPYDYEDVNKKLDEYFKNADNFGKYPDVYYLTKYLKTSKEKMKLGSIYYKCLLCGQAVDKAEYDSHYEKCSSANYLCKMSLKYYNQKLNFEKLIKSEKDVFEKYYWSFCEKVIGIMEEGLEKHALANSILVHQGKSPEYDLGNFKVKK